MRASLVFSLALLPLSSFAIVDTTSKTDPGVADATWSWVGAMGGCSAVAIGPRTVLTAAHVGASDFWLNGTAYGAVSSVDAPRMGGSTVDLRVVQMNDVLPGWYELGGSAKKKNEVTMVGYGATGVVNAVSSGYSVSGAPGVRHAGDNRISDLKSVKGYGPTLRAMLNRAGDAALGGCDSGGGWFVKGKLVGISSFTFLTKPKPEYGWAKSAYFGSSAINLTDSKVKKWIKAQLLAAASLPVTSTKMLSRSASTSMAAFSGPGLSGSSMARAQTAPEPSSLLALGLGAATWLRRRRR